MAGFIASALAFAVLSIDFPLCCVYDVIMVTLNCAYCKKSFETHPCRIKEGRKCCSQSCAFKYRGREGHPRYRGKRFCKGYEDIYKPHHPNAKANGYIAEHRFIMSEFLDRPLKKHEFVHHINHNRLDNRLENIILMDSVEHNRMHRQEEVKKRSRDCNGRLLPFKHPA